MKIRHLCTFAAILCGAGSLRAADLNWTQDFAAAKTTAAKDGKDLFLNFTGSDWCGWCVKLDEDVFSKDEFKNVVPNDYVLVKLDFPQDPSKTTPELQAQNARLKEDYAVPGPPTIILADAAGRPYGRTGYEGAGAEVFVPNLATLRLAKTGRDTAFAKAAAASGLEKAKLLAEGLAKIDPALQSTFYKEEIQAILDNDKEDTLGFGKRAKIAAQSDQFDRKLEELRPRIMDLLEKKDFDAARKTIDDLIQELGFEGEMKQRALSVKIGIYGINGDHQGALKLVDEIIALDEKSETSGMMRDLRQNIEEAIKAEKEGAPPPEGVEPAPGPAAEPAPPPDSAPTAAPAAPAAPAAE